MSDILEKICADKRAYVEKAKILKPFDALHREALKAPPARGFLRALESTAKREGAAFIAEIKKASPSAGLIRQDFSPSRLARDYEQAGAACLSVLTDEPYFQGRNEDLIEARKSCALPVLRKDFMLDVWQIAESRAMGADCVLLILAALDDAAAAVLCRAALDYGMDVLVETHTAGELERALKLPSPLIGVNSRNLQTMAVDVRGAADIVKKIPDAMFAVSESGLRTKSDVALMRAAGARGFLVGEFLLKRDDVGAALRGLRGSSS